jgi:uncharacterized membrane protein YeaQ/YmgE (transglycosylase-associated protein family)
LAIAGSEAAVRAMSKPTKYIFGFMYKGLLLCRRGAGFIGAVVGAIIVLVVWGFLAPRTPRIS